MCALTLLALAVIPAQAEECIPASRILPKTTCAKVDGVCPVGQPVQFQMIIADSPATPVPSCITGTWMLFKNPSNGTSIFSGKMTTGGESFTYTPTEAAAYTMVLNVASPPTATSALLPFNFTAGRGYIQMTKPATITEGSTGTVTFSRTNTETSTVVTWHVDKHPGLPATDISPTSGTVTLEAGEASKQFTLSAPENSTFTGTTLYLLGVDSATNGYLVPPAVGTAYFYFSFIDNDYAVVALEQAAMVVRENAGAATVGVRRSNNLSLAGSVGYVIGIAATPVATGTVNFAAGETLKTITVPIPDNQKWSPAAAGMTVELSTLPVGFERGPIQASTLTIEDDEPVPALTISNVSFSESNAGQQSGAFTVKLSPPTDSYSVRYQLVDDTAARGTDYESAAAEGILHFDPAHLQLTIPFTITGDSRHETHETFRLRLSNGDISQIRMPADATCTILNDDPELTPQSPRVTRGQTAKFTLDIGLPAATTLQLPLLSSDPSILSVPSTVRINAGQSAGTFIGTANAPGFAKISLALPNENGGATLSSNVTVEDSDTPAITSIEPASGPSAGGTSFVARGALLTGDCTLLFGGVPATAVSLTSEGMLTGRTPAHASGAVDVSLTCGANTFVLTNAFTYTAASRTRSARH
ncbi:MAG TPA: Calx-beta domain-containing protein [Thermoanaerobaculia bacterium]|nr:Calx-beta domain-containing protein [Thermoanaerobaculia bacterium]